MHITNWTRRAMTVAAGVVVVVGFAAAPAQADAYASTTGASGRSDYIKNGYTELYATDTLSDGHCARWQEKIGGGSWHWIGSSSCSGSEQQVASGLSSSTYLYRICRTGVGNCSGAVVI
ncbi:hypothetical protein ACWKSP_03525 [Micromonosporaceae bacterium Da 78-11]